MLNFESSESTAVSSFRCRALMRLLVLLFLMFPAIAHASDAFKFEYQVRPSSDRNCLLMNAFPQHWWEAVTPAWDVMFSFAGVEQRSEALKVAEYFVKSGLSRHDIFFDTWSIPACGHLDSCCRWGVARSKRLIFFVSEAFLEKVATVNEMYWAKYRHPKSIVIVVYRVPNGGDELDIQRVRIY